ncbi:MAG: hypothetical protein NDF58_05675 [archaeon YNP-LCB-024-027]|jgi:hypothetical protein|nr:hypothetical protein [Candidatus Culexarchaeum yellowstonense]
MLKSGLYFSFTLLVIAIALYIFFIKYTVKRGVLPKIRRIPGLDAIDEAIGRAVETGRPIFYSTGVGGLSGDVMPQTLAGLSLLNYVARKAAEYKASLTYLAAVPAIVPIAEDIFKSAFRENYRPEQILYIPTQTALMATVMGIYEREKPAANFLLGALYWETIILAEAGARAGAIQVGGTGRLYQVPYVVSLCDYGLIAEELLVAGAYVSKELSQLGSVIASDIIRAIVIGLSIMAFILGGLGFDLSKIFRV